MTTTGRGPAGRTRRRRGPSMTDVARVAGVSSQTVSRVANGHPGVVESTRDHVLAVMRELGYRPNGAARALKSGEFRTIGVIVFALASTGNARTVEAIVMSAAAEGYATTIMPAAAPTQDAVNGAFTRLGELAVDAAVLIMGVHLLDAEPMELPPGTKVVVADSDNGDRFSVVDTDQADGARQAVAHLLGLGHETVWHLGGPAGSFSAERREAGWRRELERAGRPVPPVVRAEWTADSGYRAGLALAEEPDCTAVFAANDEMALGLLRAFDERGLRVPEDVSVVGFDDLAASGSFIPPLTTLHQDFDKVGRLCVEGVLRQLRSEAAPTTGTILVPTRLVVRDSTAPPPKA